MFVLLHYHVQIITNHHDSQPSGLELQFWISGRVESLVLTYLPSGLVLKTPVLSEPKKKKALKNHWYRTEDADLLRNNISIRLIADHLTVILLV